MLLRFEVSNYRSILEPVEMSLVATDDDRLPARRLGWASRPALTVAAIFGPGASGKSNVLEALSWLSAAVGRSLRAWDERIPREPFRLTAGRGTTSAYEVEVVVKGVYYAYRLEVDDSAVRFESLHSYPERRKRVLFEREGSDLRFRFGQETRSGPRELLTPTTLALSAIMKFDDREVQPFGRYLAGVRAIGLRRGVAWRRSFAAAGMSASPAERQLAERLSWQPGSLADPGEVTGTQSWFSLIGQALRTLRNGQILLFDDLEAKLPPRLPARLLTLFQDRETNPHGAQLIFTSHDPSLRRYLSRDEVWLTKKIRGATTLTALELASGPPLRSMRAAQDD